MHGTESRDQVRSPLMKEKFQPLQLNEGEGTRTFQEPSRHLSNSFINVFVEGDIVGTVIIEGNPTGNLSEHLRDASKVFTRLNVHGLRNDVEGLGDPVETSGWQASLHI